MAVARAAEASAGCGEDDLGGGDSVFPGLIPSARSRRASRPSSRAQRLSSGMRGTARAGGGRS
jgi:hypothetical protein